MIIVRIVVTGANGLLGDSLCRVLKTEHEVIGITHHNLELTNYKNTMCVITDLHPDIVVHPAGIADPDRCEIEPDVAYGVNAIGTRNVAMACFKERAQMVYISSDQVFDGTKESCYNEFDEAHPVNVYGRSKLAGENFVKEILHRHYIVRSSWFFGGEKPDFVATILHQAAKKQKIELAVDQYSAPTNVDDLSLEINAIIESGQFGTYHITNEGFCSRFEFGRIILKEAGFSQDLLFPVKLSEDKRVAPRPNRTILANYMLKLSGFPLSGPFDVVLRNHIRSLKSLIN
jgi:dTDP-4-dehydrorhamnose reductase